MMGPVEALFLVLLVAGGAVLARKLVVALRR